MKTNNFFFALVLLFLSSLSNAQICFTENKGQWDKQVLFKSNNGNGSFFLLKDGYTVLLQDAKDYQALAEYYHGHNKKSAATENGQQQSAPPVVKAHAYKVKFLNANFNSVITKEKALQSYENYFIGNDPSKWASGCKSYQEVAYKNIYNGVDLVYYVQSDNLKYDLIVHPGADISKIQLQYEGASSLSIRNRKLIVGTTVGDIYESEPYTFQLSDGNKETITCNYKLNAGILSFDVAAYNKNKALVIDPSLVFSSFSRSTTDNWGFTATPGPDGSMYGGGIAQPTGFPVSPGAIQGSGIGGSSNTPPDIAIIRLSPDGTTRIYATYLGGSGLEQPHSLIADAQGNLVITGRTSSINFPVTSPDQGPTGGFDIFVTKINATGTALIGSIKIGGSGDDGVNISSNRANGPQTILRNYGDDARSEVILDANNNILLASCTRSTNFPVLGGFQTIFGGNQDGIILKLNPNCNAVIWSTYLGGSGDDGGFSIAANPQNGILYVGGGTTSASFPGTNSSVLQQFFNGGLTDGYLSRLLDNGSSVSLTNSSYLGTGDIDIVFGVKLDQLGYPYVTGTNTGVWPIVNAPYSGVNARQFIAKLLPDLSDFVYSTVFGTSNAIAPNISPNAFFVDDCENVYVTGWGGGANTRFGNYPSSSTTGLPVTPDAFQNLTDGSDFYFFVLAKKAASQLFGSFFGQRGGFGGLDHVDGGTSRFDTQGVLYLAACANCKAVDSGIPLAGSFPITAGVFGNTNPAVGGGGCNLGMVKLRFNLAGNACTVTSTNSVSNDQVELSFFPNPSKGRFLIRYRHANTNGRYGLKIYDARGAIVLEQQLLFNRLYSQTMVDLTTKGAGVYFVEISDSKGKRVAASKILIE